MRNRKMRKQLADAASGYTILEILFAILVTTIGFVGMIGLQAAHISTVRSSFDTLQGLTCGQHFLEIVRAEALTWTVNNPIQNQTGTTYLKNYPTSKVAGQTSNWFSAPETGTERRKAFVCGANVFNEGIMSVYAAGNQKYCIHYRFAWLIPDFLMRVDVRVLWPSVNAKWNSADFKICKTPTAGLNTGGLADKTSDVEYVTITSSVKVNTNVTSL